MRRLQALIFLTPLLVTGCIPRCGRDAGTPVPTTAPQVLSSPADQAPQQGSEASAESSPTEQALSPEAMSSSVSEASSSVSSPESPLEPLIVAPGSQWILDTRDIFAKMGKLIAIEGGRYELKEGETRPDPHAEYARLHSAFGEMEIDDSHEDIRRLFTELDAEVGAIIKTLSAPPTVEELKIARERGMNLWPKMDELSGFVEKLRR